MNDPTSETDWFDDQPYPGPEFVTLFEEMNQMVVVGSRMATAIAKLMEVYGQTFRETTEALEKVGIYTHVPTPTTSHFTMPTDPPKIPRHVGPRSRQTFDRKGKRKF